jgi:hypothetical protein
VGRWEKKAGLPREGTTWVLPGSCVAPCTEGLPKHY